MRPETNSMQYAAGSRQTYSMLTVILVSRSPERSEGEAKNLTTKSDTTAHRTPNVN